MRVVTRQKALSSMKSKISRPFLSLVVILLSHDGELVRVSFLTTFICMSSVRFEFFHNDFGERDGDGFDNGLDDDKLIVFVCGCLAVYSSFTREMGMRMTMVDGNMAMFVQIGVFVHGISI